MPTDNANSSLLVMKDYLAPYRGTWVVYVAEYGQGFTAWHQLEDRSEGVRLLEQLSFSTLAEVAAFAAHLRLHGWSATDALVP